MESSYTEPDVGRVYDRAGALTDLVSVECSGR